MSNHLSKSLFSIPRLKKSRSRQQNQPENPTSLCLNALTADDAFLRFAAVPDKTFFSPRNPKRNSIIFLCIPSLPRLFHPLKAPKGILFLTLHIPLRAPFFTLEKPQRELFFLAFPICRGLFHPLKAPKGVLFLTLHSPSAAPFSPLKSPKGNFIFNTAYPPHVRLFFSPRSPERNFIFSLYIHPPSAAARGSRAALQYFQSYRPSLHHTGHIFTLHAEYIQRSCPKCVAQRRNGEIFPPANATAATHRGAGTAIQDEYKKKLYPSARRGIYYTGIIGRRKWQQEIYYRGLSAGEGVVGVLYMDFRRVKGWRGYNNMELRKGWQGGY